MTDDAVMPAAFLELTRSVPCFERCRCRDKEEHDVGLVKVRTVEWQTNYGLFLVEPAAMERDRRVRQRRFPTTS